MLRLALVFLIVALVAGLFGFGLIDNIANPAAQLAFFIFLALAFITLLASALHAEPAP